MRDRYGGEDTRSKQEAETLYEALYEQYGKPLEATHQGKYLAISPEGKTILGESLLEVAQKAAATFGPGNFVYKISERVVGKWR